MKLTNIPRNSNISIRVSEILKEEFKTLAYFHNLSISEWANFILTKHMYDYDRRNKIEHLMFSVAEENLKTQLIHRLLKKFEIFESDQGLTSKKFDVNQLKLAIKILDNTKFISDRYIDKLILFNQDEDHH